MIFCSLYSGSSGNSTFISSSNTKILIDAGLSGKYIERALEDIGESPDKLDGIFITHEHIDHTKGVGIISRKYDIPIYANKPTWIAMEKTLGKVKEHNIKIMDSADITIKDLDISTFPISHDAACPVGYSVSCSGKKACVATDMGYFSEDVKNKIKDADVILLESNHDIEMLKFGPYPYSLKRRILSDIGHLSNDACGKAIVDITNNNKKHIMLGHLSKTNNYPELAYKTVVNILEYNAITPDKDIYISMAKRDMPSGHIEF